MFRKAIFHIHKWIGATLGLLIALICFSGAAIVYKPELEKLSVRNMAFVTPAKKTVPLQTMLENVRKQYPTLSISNMVLYGGKHCAYSFRTTSPEEKGRIQVYVNPYTGEVLGMDHYRNKLFQWLYDFHVKLFLPQNGTTVVAVCGYIFLLLIFSGLWLLPKHRLFYIKRTMKIKAKLYKLHLIIGSCTALFIVLITITGTYFGFKPAYQSFFESIASGKALNPAPKVETYEGESISLDMVVEAAQNTLKDGTPMMIFFPQNNQSVYSVRMRRQGDWERTGSNHIYIHPLTGEVVKTNIWKDKPTAEKIVRSMYFIHYGTFFGHFSRILWVFIGLTVPFLYFTGFYIWYSKLKKE